MVAGVGTAEEGYAGHMSQSPDVDPNQATEPDVGLVPDEDLPEDLQPTDDNPLAQTPEQREAGEKEKQEGEAPKVEGMPDMGDPGPGA